MAGHSRSSPSSTDIALGKRNDEGNQKEHRNFIPLCTLETLYTYCIVSARDVDATKQMVSVMDYCKNRQHTCHLQALQTFPLQRGRDGNDCQPLKYIYVSHFEQYYKNNHCTPPSSLPISCHRRTTRQEYRIWQMYDCVREPLCCNK